MPPFLLENFAGKCCANSLDLDKKNWIHMSILLALSHLINSLDNLYSLLQHLTITFLDHLVFVMASFFRSLLICGPFVWKRAPHMNRFTNLSLPKFVSTIPMNDYWQLELIREITLVVTMIIMFLILIIIANLHNPKFIHTNLIGFCIVCECLVLH